MYTLMIDIKTKLELPNGQIILLEKGDKLKFSTINDKEEKKETISEEHFLINALDWDKDNLNFNNNNRYAIIESRFLDRVDSAHLSPDMYLDKKTSIQIKYLKIRHIPETNKIKLEVPDLYFYDLPNSIDIVFIKSNDNEEIKK